MNSHKSTSIGLAVLLIGLYAGYLYFTYRSSLTRGIPERGWVPRIAYGHRDLQSGAVDFPDPFEREIVLTAGEQQFYTDDAKLGIKLNKDASYLDIRRYGAGDNIAKNLRQRIALIRGDAVVYPSFDIDTDVLDTFLEDLKVKVDHPMRTSRLDLEKRTVVPGMPSESLSQGATKAAIIAAARKGRKSIPIVIEQGDPPPPEADALSIDISHVLASYETPFSSGKKKKNRAHNLFLGASKLNGTIIQPGAHFSFNDVVGPRTRQNGYRIAPVISQGEIVDGEAGGACQLSTTLFAASFFAGLDLVRSRPHSRPSPYIQLGLDAAVYYPTTDVQLSNPYDFPIVLHYKLTNNRVRVEILGKRRPWGKVALVREILKTSPYGTIERADPEVPMGRRIVKQKGLPGYKVLRRRLFFKSRKTAIEEPDQEEKRKMSYPPTLEIISVGTGPADMDYEEPKEHVFPEVKDYYELSM